LPCAPLNTAARAEAWLLRWSAKRDALVASAATQSISASSKDTITSDDGSVFCFKSAYS
jgi:hypothetical protein